jgi:hypothetical protein
MKKLYHGSCHCGAVRFECRLDLAPADRRSEPELPGIWWTSTFRCNCSSCMKTRLWKGFVRAGDFHLTDGREALADYRYGSKEIHHFFCRHCGVHPFGNASFEQMGGEFYAVNIYCLDDATDAELAEAPIIYEDGRNDDWEHPPAETRYF